MKAKPAKTALTPSQCILFAYSKEKFTEDASLRLNFAIPTDPSKVTTDSREALKKGSLEVESQNFAVRFLTEKSNQKKWVVIAAHFKSKEDGFAARKLMGDEISKFIKVLKNLKPPGAKTKINKPSNAADYLTNFQIDYSQYSDANFLLMGDLNALIEEISFDLNTPIKQLASQVDKVDKNGNANIEINPVKTYIPNQMIDELKNFYRRSVINFNDLIDYYQVLLTDRKFKPRIYDVSVKEEDKIGKLPFPETFDKLDKEFQGLIKILQILKQYKDDLSGRLRTIDTDLKNGNFWIELNNFPTQRKIRLKEIDYDHPYYQRVVNNLAYYQTQEGSILKFDCLQFFATNKKFDIPDRTAKKMEVMQGPTFSNRFQKSGQFIDALKCLNQEFDKASGNLFKQHMIGAYRDALYSVLFQEEKIDFILLQTKSTYKITKVESGNQYKNLATYGLPNKDMASDHVPSKITIELVATQHTSQAEKKVEGSGGESTKKQQLNNALEMAAEIEQNYTDEALTEGMPENLKILLNENIFTTLKKFKAHEFVYLLLKKLRIKHLTQAEIEQIKPEEKDKKLQLPLKRHDLIKEMNEELFTTPQTLNIADFDNSDLKELVGIVNNPKLTTFVLNYLEDNQKVTTYFLNGPEVKAENKLI